MNFLYLILFSLPILIGVIIVNYVKNNKPLSEISIALAFSLLSLLVFFELVPESIHHTSVLNVILFSIVGFGILMLLDFFIPAHEHSSDKKHLSHIGIMTLIALSIHNLIEGMLLYTTLSEHFELGILLGIGIGIHNLPLGLILGATFKASGFSKWKVILFTFIPIIAAILGGIVINSIVISENLLGIMFSLTIGVLLYVIIFEIIRHLFHQKNKHNIIGFIFGIVIFLISLLFHSH